MVSSVGAFSCYVLCASGRAEGARAASMVTIEEVWRQALPAESKLLAGRAGLAREVTWAATMRTRAPVFDRLEGGELALVPLANLGLLDEQVTLPYVIRHLAENNVAGLAVLGEVPAEALEAAEAAGTPLIALPAGTRMNELERGVIRFIYARQALLQQQTAELSRQLDRLVLERRGLGGVAQTLARLTERGVVIADRQGAILHLAGSGTVSEEVLATAWQTPAEMVAWARQRGLNSTDPPTARMTLNAPGLGAWVAAIVDGESLAGCVALVGPSGELGERERQVVGRAGAACAIEFFKRREVVEKELSLQRPFIDDWITGNFGDWAAMVERGQYFNHDLSVPYVPWLIEWQVSSSANGRAPLLSDESLSRALLERIDDEVKRWQQAALYSLRPGRIVALIACPTEADAERLAKRAEQTRQRLVTAWPDLVISAGIGRREPDPAQLPRSYREAQQALSMGRRLFGPGRTTTFGELGIYRLLFHLHGRTELEQFYQETVGRLVEHDRRTEGDLVKTLEAFFAHHGNVSKTAEALYLHRNTLIYRLDRIGEITGLDLSDPETRLCLQVGLKIRNIQM